MAKKEAKKEEKSPLAKLEFREEIDEEVNICGPADANKPTQYYATGWPGPKKRYRIVFESYNASIEETYFWILNHLKQDQSYHHVLKVTDSYAASENSSLWGVQQQRLGIQQDKVSQYMAVIGKMTKELFQIVREIRILKEKLGHYYGVEKGIHSADIALKGYWIDLVEGGSKSPASVYGLAQQLGFVVLPDLFYATFVKPGQSVDQRVEEQAGKFNPKLKEVLKRKLEQYVRWREETKKELDVRHKFTLRYLRQHWNSIRMYIAWIKPYLKNVRRLSTEEKFRDSDELITSMEGAMLEIEFLAKRQAVGTDDSQTYPVVLAHFLYRVRPAMNFSTEYQRGPIHMGRVTVTLRAYGWTQKEIDNYLKLRNDEDVELLGWVDEGMKAAIEALGDELKIYLEEAEEEAGLSKKEEEREKPKAQPVNMLEPFGALGGGFKDLFLMAFPFSFDKKQKPDEALDANRGAAAKTADGTAWQTYKNYKKSHGMLAW